MVKTRTRILTYIMLCGSLFLWKSFIISSFLFLSKWSCFASPSTNYSSGNPPATWSRQRKLQLREATRRLWHHGFDSYMDHAFPLDELQPISCSGQGPDWLDPTAIHFNDVLANCSVTLIDVLDTFVVMNNRTGFAYAVQQVIDNVSFDVDTKPQVFEITIRVLGGLLSAHIFADDPRYGFRIEGYNGELLKLAYDLGKRLLPAFNTPTGIPFARINLRRGILPNETINTCTAGAGSLILEFAVLSRLTTDDRFENVARKAFFAIWNRRSEIGLVGNGINIMTGAWQAPTASGIGAGIDSFYEYALKMYVMSGEAQYFDVFEEAYKNVMNHSLGYEGYWFRTVNMHNGDLATTYIDSLSAFWAGLQVLAGDVENAIKSHLIYWNLWLRFSGIPETYDVSNREPISSGYPLRPEFIESTYFLYRATGDTFYLDVGERVYHDLIMRAHKTCGLATVSNLLTGTNEDRMESFVLSETLKYLYLLFDEDNQFHSEDSDFVFSTEGHLLRLPPSLVSPPSRVRREIRGVQNHECSSNPRNSSSELFTGVSGRPDFEYPRYMVRSKYGKEIEVPKFGQLSSWSANGFCEAPKVQQYSLEYILSANTGETEEDVNPAPYKLRKVGDGYVLWNVTGIRMKMTSRLDGKGYDITRLGPYEVYYGEKVYIADPAVLRIIDHAHLHPKSSQREAEVVLRFAVWPPTESNVDLSLWAGTSYFGGNPSGEPSLRFGKGSPAIRVTRDPYNPTGCEPYLHDMKLRDTVFVVDRGDCTFIDKLWNAKEAGAVGVLAINNQSDELINATADENDPQGDVADVVLLALGRSDGRTVLNLMNSVRSVGASEIVVQIEGTAPRPTFTGKDMLFVNSHPLLNTILLR